jgi:selenide,water dikinase
VFVGGGHAHALALRMLAMRPIDGLRITLISPASHTPYSGMLPGLVAGHYSFEQTHIDLARVCQWAGVRFVCAEVEAVDPVRQILSIRSRPDIAYDVLSIDVGSQPELESVPGASLHSVPVKPVAGLWQRWNTLRDKLLRSSTGTAHRIAMVGGGAGSVELIAAMAEMFRAAESFAAQHVSFELFCGAGEILQGYNSRARNSAQTALLDYGIKVHLNSRVESVEPGVLSVRDGESHRFDELFWCTGAAAAPWIAASGLKTDRRGFLATRNTLQSLDYDNIFGTGDCATQVDQPRPKAGVYAVRQGPVLAENLRNFLFAKALREHIPQQRFLSLLSLGAKRATADRGVLSATGSWVWRWKDKIDREFMSRFETLPEMAPGVVTDCLPQLEKIVPQAPCGGCGAKVAADGLASVLLELAEDYPTHCPIGGAEDTVLIPGSADSAIVQSIDTLRQITADPWLMGRIAANHALSDLYASGARPVSALASISLPFSADTILQRELKQILAGALFEFSAVDCKLLGGHTMQGPELTVGFVVNGAALSPDLGFLPKRSLQSGDHLVLTKPLGTGTLFAGHMQLKADGRDIQTAMDMMLQSNAAAAELALKHNASACTDVTGFGLLGHLQEMLEAGQGAELQLSKLHALPGALESMDAGIRSTMHEANSRVGGRSLAIKAGNKTSRFELLFDPQTSGGLLMGVSPNCSAALCVDLIAAGYASAAVIGNILLPAEDAQASIIIV